MLARAIPLSAALLASLASCSTPPPDGDYELPPDISFEERMGPDPHSENGAYPGQDSPAVHGCPDVWELSNGDFAVIGIRKTKTLKPELPKSAGVGPDEEIVVVPREVMLKAKADLAAER